VDEDYWIQSLEQVPVASRRRADDSEEVMGARAQSQPKTPLTWDATHVPSIGYTGFDLGGEVGLFYARPALKKSQRTK
jgi:hypothetical protein